MQVCGDIFRNGSNFRNVFKIHSTFSELCKNLHLLKLKKVQFVRSVAAQRSFGLLKDTLVFASNFANPDYSLQLEVYCDDCDDCVCTMLSQKGRPIGFALTK